MKWLNKIFVILLINILFFACKKQVLPAKPQPTPFSVEAVNNAAISSTGGQVQVDIKTQTDGWWVVIPPAAEEWCSSSRTYGSANATVTITLKANATGISRTVDIQFNPTFDLPAQTVTIKQL